MPRKRRNDRNHLVYKLTCSVTGEFYIGVTFIELRSPPKSLRRRWLAHCRNAFKYDKQTRLAKSMREHGEDSFSREVLTVIRGKANCHAAERQLILELKPPLNMEGMGYKKGRKAIS